MSEKKISKKPKVRKSSPKKAPASATQAMAPALSLSGSGVPKEVSRTELRQNRDLYLLPTMRVA